MILAILVFSILGFLNSSLWTVAFIWSLADDLKKSKKERAAQLAALKNGSNLDSGNDSVND